MQVHLAYLSCLAAYALGRGSSQPGSTSSSRQCSWSWAQCHCPGQGAVCPAESLLRSGWPGLQLQPSTAQRHSMVRHMPIFSCRHCTKFKFCKGSYAVPAQDSVGLGLLGTIQRGCCESRHNLNLGKVIVSCPPVAEEWRKQISRSFSPLGVASLLRSAEGASQAQPQFLQCCRRPCACWNGDSGASAVQAAHMTQAPASHQVPGSLHL